MDIRGYRTDGQTADAQVEALTATGAATVFRATTSGTQTDRALLRKVLAVLDDIAFACNQWHTCPMPSARPTNRAAPAQTRRDRPASRTPSGKVAVTVRLDPDCVQRLQAAAAVENRTLTNYVETALIRDLAQRDDTSRVITMLAAPGTSSQLDPADILRAPDESDAAYAKRQALLTELWSIPDSD